VLIIVLIVEHQSASYDFVALPKANRAMPKRLSRKRKKDGTPAPSRLPDLHLIESLLDKFGGGLQVNAVDAAQDIMYDAWDASDKKRRIALAKKALELSPLCADAYVLLAQETAKDLDQTIEIYRQGVEAGEKALGKTAFREDAGHFWGLLETRPYMRARHGLAQALWDKGLRDETVTHYRDMLRLNPNDNQGIRYLLLDCLLILGRDDDATKLIKRYKEDGAAAWSWSRALLAFRQGGDCPESRSALSQAIGDNTHVAALLFGDKKMPRRLPAYIGVGDKNEAVAYVHGAAAAWTATPGALTWVRACQPR
jgi:tetratricopeptide (TPR) repeat protein